MYTPKDLETLRSYFEKTTLPKSIELSTGITILNTTLFLESHFRVIETNGDKRQRLHLFKSMIEKTAVDKH